MADLPTHTELFEEFKAQVLGDPDTQLNNFETGSVLYTFATVAATASRAGMRYFSNQLRTAFIGLAEDSDLDYVVADRLGPDAPTRNSGESDEDFLERVYSYIDSIIRGTPPAFELWLTVIDGRANTIRIDEQLKTGITDIYITPVSTVSDVDAYLDELRAELDDWRTLNGRVNLLEETA